jgi:hypothetical protein
MGIMQQLNPEMGDGQHIHWYKSRPPEHLIKELF